MNEITKRLLGQIADIFNIDSLKDVAYNIREDKMSAGRQSTKNITIESKPDAPGLIITVKPGTDGEKVYIPACVTKGNVDDLVYNDFYIGEGADVTIVAGCGIHNDEDEFSRHNGVHKFLLAKGARVLYVEKHIGTGEGAGERVINPETVVELDEDSYLEMDTVQLSGVHQTRRRTAATVGKNARLIIRERIMTDGDESAVTDFSVDMAGEGGGVNLISRSVAKGRSHQEFLSKIFGNAPCTGHSECDAILVGNGTVSATPELAANHADAALIHEAAIGKIAGEQIIKLMTLGLTEQEAEQKIIDGFLR